MEKIQASKLIEADPDFIEDIARKLDEREKNNPLKQEVNVYQASVIANKDPRTIHRYIHNYLKDVEGKTQLRASKPEGSRDWIIKRSDLEEILIKKTKNHDDIKK